MSMLNAVKTFSMSSKNGVFINPRWAHCQAERKDTWFPGNSQPGEDKVRRKQKTLLFLQLISDHDSYIVSNTF